MSEVFRPGDIVRVNEDTAPAAIAGQVCEVVARIADHHGEVYVITVSHPHYNTLVYVRDELTLVERKAEDG